MSTRNSISVTSVSVRENRITVDFTATGAIEGAFRARRFFAEYDRALGGLDDSVAVVPFLCSALPVAWAYDAEVRVPSLDRDFSEAIDRVREGYREIYPCYRFEGSLKAERLVDNRVAAAGGSPIVLFSGGLDATATLSATSRRGPSS